MKGLPDAILLRLEGWLGDHPYPSLTASEGERERPIEEGKGPILFGSQGFFTLPPGRGYIVQALAAGYLARQTPDLENWARVVESRVPHERHPAVWTMTLLYMSILFIGDRRQATQLYDAVIQICPAVLRHPAALQAIARVVGRVEPRERLQGWLGRLRGDDAATCLQA